MSIPNEISDIERDPCHQLRLINDEIDDLFDGIDDDEIDEEDEIERHDGMTSDAKLLNHEYREDCFNTADEDDEDDLCGVFGADDEDNFEED